ncbi:isoflavone reductase-like protein [Aspergillus udagawae]|uniref:Isoflavone reductase-like protein n=1 Tax=Aspergillus udagawae TaxID=91492 RepID=A0ABQ1B3L5_9EURO|nr:isoflavone reductase-like protein [Aspergillus udagawae]GFG09346.1 isoflavone reductase-like protein [Aspergillus udagawae]
MSSIQKVALLGKGFLGSAVLEHLVKAGFTVTVLTRSQDDLQGIPAGVKVAEVEYSSVGSLEVALRGHDAVVSTVAPLAIPLQKPAIDASIRAGVRRFIPADFGALTLDPRAHELPNHSRVLEIQQYLREKASSGELEYTFFAVGPFLDNVLSKPFALNYESHTAVVYDDGNHPFSTTSVNTIGKAVAAALKNASATKNRVLRIHDTVLTQQKLLALARKYAAPGVVWMESRVNAEAELASAIERLTAGDFTPPAHLAVIRAAVLGGKYEAEYKDVDNEFLGLGFLGDSELEKKFSNP